MLRHSGEALRGGTHRGLGVDIDRQTEEQSDYALSCRVFRTEAGFVGQPDERWVREALLSNEQAPAA